MSRDDQDRLSALDQQVEARLQNFVPSAPAIDRDRLMFDAGWQAALVSLEAAPRRGAVRFGWPAATALATAASVMLAVMLVRQSTPVESVATAHREEVAPEQIATASTVPTVDANDEATELPPTTSPQLPWPYRLPVGGDNYLAVRSAVLSGGVNMLRSTGYSTTSGETPEREPATMRNLLNEYLPPSETRSDSPAESDPEPMGRTLPNKEHFS